MASASGRGEGLSLSELRLEALPEFLACETAMRADPVIGPHVDHLVGSSLAASALQPKIAIWRLLAGALTDGQVSSEALEEGFEQFLECLVSETVEARSFVGLFGVSIVDGPLHLPEGLTLRRVEPGDFGPLIMSGVGDEMPLGLAVLHRLVEHLPEAVAEIRFRIPVRQEETIGSSPPVLPAMPDLHLIGDRLVMALALSTNARVARTGVITEELHWFASGMSWSPHPRSASLPGGLAQLGHSDIGPLTALLDRLSSPGVTNRKHLELALHRFVLALGRFRDDDRLIDLAIAAEALLLDQDAELSLRLALRAATLAEATSLIPRDVFERMRNSYRTRSRLVHGDPVASEDVRSACGNLESDLRALLAQYVLMAAETPGATRLRLDEARYLPSSDET